MLQRGWEEEATAWYAMADRKSDAYAAQVRIAHSFAAEAQARRDGGGGQAMAAAHFVEMALLGPPLLLAASRSREHLE